MFPHPKQKSKNIKIDCPCLSSFNLCFPRIFLNGSVIDQKKGNHALDKGSTLPMVDFPHPGIKDKQDPNAL